MKEILKTDVGGAARECPASDTTKKYTLRDRFIVAELSFLEFVRLVRACLNSKDDSG